MLGFLLREGPLSLLVSLFLASCISICNFPFHAERAGRLSSVVPRISLHLVAVSTSQGVALYHVLLNIFTLKTIRALSISKNISWHFDWLEFGGKW